MMRFVKTADEVVSVEMSLEALSRIAVAFGAFQSDYEGTDGFTSHDESLGKVFSSAYEALTKQDEPVVEEDVVPLADWERELLEGK